MGLEVTELRDGASVETHTTELYRADRKLWLDADGEVVEDGDPAAAVLYATEGDELPLEEAVEKGLVKQAKPAANKGKKPAANKGKK